MQQRWASQQGNPQCVGGADAAVQGNTTEADVHNNTRTGAYPASLCDFSDFCCVVVLPMQKSTATVTLPVPPRELG